MKRSKFIKKIGLLGLLPSLGIHACSSSEKPEEHQLKEELLAAWKRSEKMTLTNLEQMPPDFFTFKYTDEAMTFSEQWRHCVLYTCSQLSSRAGLANPYMDIKLPIQLSKEDVVLEIKKMYTFVRKSISELSTEKFFTTSDFAGDEIPLWRLFYALENHIIHHRGQCVVYLRLNGVIPKGYYGW